MFDIAVAGYPEGHEDDEDEEKAVQYLKEKVDAGATFIITQMFYDADLFLKWVERIRKAGINVPIIPGVMPISTYDAFIRRAKWSNARIPPDWLEQLEEVKNNDAAVRERGAKLVAEMCKKIKEAGIHHFHFYTMNLEKSSAMVIEDLEIEPSVEDKSPLPWKKSLALKRSGENVRPIFWKNRNKSYIARTAEWDEFPNGRWGDSRSPAFGELDTYGYGMRLSNEEARKVWGYPKEIQDIKNIFCNYLLGKIPNLPWSEAPISVEIDSIRNELIRLNGAGFFTINSQPAINGLDSSHPVHGWGPSNGYVYQKAYLEFFCPPDKLKELTRLFEGNKSVTYYAVNRDGLLFTNTESDGPNAVTWGVFPGKEIIQPTIVETISFLAWKDEAFRLGCDWASCYHVGATSRDLIMEVVNSYYLVNLVHK